MERPAKGEFRLRVLGGYARHDARPGGLVHDVGHRWPCSASVKSRQGSISPELREAIKGYWAAIQPVCPHALGICPRHATPTRRRRVRRSEPRYRHPEPTPSRSDGCCSIRSECPDHRLIFGRRHLQRTVLDYTDYYNRWRPHRSLGQRTPCRASWEPRQAPGKPLTGKPILGGLHLCITGLLDSTDEIFAPYTPTSQHDGLSFATGCHSTSSGTGTWGVRLPSNRLFQPVSSTRTGIERGHLRQAASLRPRNHQARGDRGWHDQVRNPQSRARL